MVTTRSTRVEPGPYQRIVTRTIRAIGLQWISIDEGPREKRVARAPDFVLDRELHRMVTNIDDMQKSILVLIAFFRDQTVLLQARVWSREISDVELDVMPVIGLGQRVGFMKA